MKRIKGICILFDVNVYMYMEAFTAKSGAPNRQADGAKMINWGAMTRQEGI